MDKQPEEGEFLLYTAPDGDIKVDVYFMNETVWLTQKKMAELFDVDVRTISDHLKNVYQSGELTEEATIRKNRIVQKEGNRDVQREVAFYNLDAIISVGYRVNSAQATQFRIWATKTLREFIVKGFVLDDERLKNGSHFGKDYFDELIVRIQEIRASERRFYQKITDIYSQCSIDYNKDAEITKTFYATVQNKLHWAITGETAAEIIASRANANKPHMGLTSWKDGPVGKIHSTDVGVAKNYLTKDEISQLNQLVNMYLDYAQLQASRHIPMYMRDWAARLDSFLQFNEYDILHNAGKISAETAKTLALAEYEKFRVVQDKEFESDFDREIKKHLPKHKKSE